MLIQLLMAASLLTPVQAKTPVCTVNKKPYSNVQQALKSKGTIRLLKNVHLKQLTLNKKQTIDLNHHQLSVKKLNVSSQETIKNGLISGTVTVNKAGSLKTAKVSVSKLINKGSVRLAGGYFENVSQKGNKNSKLTITSGEFKNLSVYDGTVNISGGHFTGRTSFYQENGKVSGGTFNVENLINYADNMKVTGSNIKEIIVRS